MSEAVNVMLSQKAGTLAASGSVAAWLASVWGWVDANMLKLSAAASFIYLIVLIVSSICSMIRQNRESKLNVLLMQKKLRETEHEAD